MQTYSAPDSVSDENILTTVSARSQRVNLNSIHCRADASKKSTQSEATDPDQSNLPLKDTKIDQPLNQEANQKPSMASSALHEHDLALHMQDSVMHSPASLEMEVEMEMEKEMEGKWNSIPKHHRAVPDPAKIVFEHWQRVMEHPKAVLDKQRRRFIRQALDKGYSINDLCQAITGCSLTPHNRGHNDRGERYDGLHVILRTADQIDRFIRNAANPPRPGKAEQRLQNNLSAADAWLTQNQAPGA